MDKRKLIVSLAESILKDIRNERLKLSNIMLKIAELSHLVKMDSNVDYFKNASKEVEIAQAVIDTYPASISSAKDPDISIQSANPNEFTGWHVQNHSLERTKLKNEFERSVTTVGGYKAEGYAYVMKLLYLAKFSKIAGSVFNTYKVEVEKKLLELYPELKEALESIDSNFTSENSRDWAAASAECRNLMFSLSRTLWKKPDETFKLIDGSTISLKGASEKNKLIAYVDSKIPASDDSKRGRKKRLFGTIHEVCGIGGKAKQKINKIEASSVLINTYILIYDLIALTGMEPIE